MNNDNYFINVAKASEIIGDNTEKFGQESILFTDSIGRILAEEVFADRDFPAYDNVRMDGIALQMSAIQNGLNSFYIQGIQGAGEPALNLEDGSKCIEVMTGSILPLDTDIVIPYECLIIEGSVASLKLEAGQIKNLTRFQNVQRQASQQEKGSVLLKKYQKISSAELGILASVGKSKVLVQKEPKIICISTGNELVAVHHKPKKYQIRRSNVYSLQAILKENGFKADIDHIIDDKKVLLEKIREYLVEYDVLLFSGAVSMGKFDFLPQVFEELRVEEMFYKVKQRPGKPFWFGKKGIKTIFAFPGNPISTYVNCLFYFLPWITQSLEYKNDNYTAQLTEDFSFKPNLVYFLSVSVVFNHNQYFAIPNKGKGSGDINNLRNTDGFLCLPENKCHFKKGDIYPLILIKK